MYVVIVGCGRVGSELASLLSLEGHDVVIIDKQFEAFSRLGDAFNGIMITGSGVSTRVLQEAGIEKAGIFVPHQFRQYQHHGLPGARGIFRFARDRRITTRARPPFIRQSAALMSSTKPTFLLP